MSQDTHPGLLHLFRESSVAKNPQDRFPGDSDLVVLASCQLLHPDRAREYQVRSGRLRVSELLPDGREVTRALLQAGSRFAALDVDRKQADPVADIYPVDRMILMSLGATEILTRTHERS